MAQNEIAPVTGNRIPPQFCQYVGGPCDQNFSTALKSEALFLFPTRPEPVAATIESAVSHLSKIAGEREWKSWKDLDIAGQIIFCEICKAIRFARLVVADVTTLNFNVLFEIGFAFGLGVPVMPIRDTSNTRSNKDFEELGILDTLGYFDYRNSSQLSEGVLARVAAPPILPAPLPLNSDQPLYVVKTGVESNGMIKLMSLVKKSRLKFRTCIPKKLRASLCMKHTDRRFHPERLSCTCWVQT